MIKKQTIIPTILWGFLILVLTLKPSNPKHQGLFNVIYIDKIAHFSFWAMWYLVFHFSYAKFLNDNETSRTTSNRSKFVVFAIVFGGIIELLQLKLNWGRSAEWLDLIADSLGVIVPYTVLLVFRKSK